MKKLWEKILTSFNNEEECELNTVQQMDNQILEDIENYHNSVMEGEQWAILMCISSLIVNESSECSLILGRPYLEYFVEKFPEHEDIVQKALMEGELSERMCIEREQ